MDHHHKLGFSVSLLCAVHCITLPLLLTVLPLVGSEWAADQRLEWGLMLISLPIAAYTLGKDFQQHHRPGALWLAGLGFLGILGGHLLLQHHAFTHVVAGLGGLLVAVAFWLNWRYRPHCAVEK
ncbi:MerC mercury resistance protein [Catalinimonas alkaloidigena]|uniref:MerC mercury resistance protein n=1 Tax=Catalinimonas alkaloidigena TaxID=1075417 RepID=A0A1G9DMI4_9BACT|nr:MerC domain-containing protein [Catalinimonas alkaloidigena]SDK64985.1 MerC mercury resistance protein [Catalinimonas alkaloidigena]